jgi:hypothetical protein
VSSPLIADFAIFHAAQESGHGTGTKSGMLAAVLAAPSQQSTFSSRSTYLPSGK